MEQGRTLIMGILNVTPDSFSDGGRWFTCDKAIARAHRMIEDGADIIDVGGESTRPGSSRIDSDEEWSRIGEIITRLVREGIVVSVDTLHAHTAQRAADAGAAIINDVSGGMWDPLMNDTVSQTDCAYVIQHYRGLPGAVGESFDYGDNTVATLMEELKHQITCAYDAGVEAERIIIDPGLGFSLTIEQSWEIIDQLELLREYGHPVLIGASRKRLTSAVDQDKDLTTADITARCINAGMWAVRVHNVELNARQLHGMKG